MAKIVRNSERPSLPARDWRVTRRDFGRLSVAELGRPHARLGNPNLGIPETLIQPLYDIYFVAVSTAMPTLQLFSVPIGSQYNSGGVTAFNKTLDHTYLTQQGMLQSSYSFIIRALSFTVQSLQGSTHPIGPHLEDLSNLLSSWCELNINQKPYFDGILAWIPCGGGVTYSGFGTLSAASSYASTNGWPVTSNVFELPGGIQILPQENFYVKIDPSQNAGGAPSTLAAAGNPTDVLAAGISAWFRLDGMLVRVAG